MVETGKSYRGQTGRPKSVPSTAPRKPVPTDRAPLPGAIAQAVVSLRRTEVGEMVERAVAEGKPSLDILEECRAGMERVGELYSAGEYFLAELMMSAVIFQKVMERLEPLLLQSHRDISAEPVVIATPKGDVHDIGKNIVATRLKAEGFEVHDLGVNVPPRVIVDKVAQTHARVIAMSALITPTFVSMKEVVELLKERGLREGRFIIIGGGPTTPRVRDHVGADAWTLDPKEGVDLCKAFLGRGKERGNP
jgi:methylmalonyl-CoA mutase cobalamin-binding domain/chain